MRCIKPIILKPQPGEIVGMKVPCGQCIACRLNKVRDWTLRIMHESRYHKDNCFLTLTYAPEYQKPSLNKSDLQKFFKRLRKRIGQFRYYACGEYGENHNLAHFHICLFGVGINHEVFNGKKYDRKGKGYYQENNPCWSFGNVYIAELNYATARYVASYVNKKVFKDTKLYQVNNLTPEFVVMSRNPGIGYNFVEQYKGLLLRQKNVRFKGKAIAMPRYYENKVFDTEELKELRKAEKQEHVVDDSHNVDVVLSYALTGKTQYEKNITSRINLKAKRSLNFEKAYKDFKSHDVLGERSRSSN